MCRIDSSSVRNVLKKRAMSLHCITYKDLASLLGVTSPPVIATVTNLLEILIEEDVANGRPILSSLVVQKSGQLLPRLGFFEKLDSLNRIKINDAFDESEWHESELKKLKAYYEK